MKKGLKYIVPVLALCSGLAQAETADLRTWDSNGVAVLSQNLAVLTIGGTQSEGVKFSSPDNFYLTSFDWKFEGFASTGWCEGGYGGVGGCGMGSSITTVSAAYIPTGVQGGTLAYVQAGQLEQASENTGWQHVTIAEPFKGPVSFSLSGSVANYDHWYSFCFESPQGGLECSGYNSAGSVGEMAATFSIKNVTLLSSLAPVASVPEPETYALFLAGLGLIGTLARRRQAA